MTRKSTINSVTLFLLPVFGICPGSSCILISRVFWIVSAAFILYCHYCYFLLHFDPDNFFDLVDCLCSFLAHLNVITKLLMFWINEQKFVEILALITDDWSNCAGNNADVRVATSKTKLSDRITYTILILNTIAIVTYCIGIILADVDVTNEANELLLLNKLELPFKVNTQRMYRCVLFTEFIYLIFCNLGTGVMNTMLLTFVLHAGGQMDILQYRLAQLAIGEINNEQKSIIIATSNIIRKHQNIIHFSENIEHLYTHSALLLFASNTLLICAIGFLIMTAIGSPDAVQQIIKCILFFTITNLEAYIFCYAGEYLSIKSKEIGLATYNCAWYNLRPKESRVFLFIILRAQKQLTLTAGKMMDLSLQSFASIINISGSYLSVLLAMQ